MTLQVSAEDSYVELPVIRRNGTDGTVSVDYQTCDGTGPAAIAGESVEGSKHRYLAHVGMTLRRMEWVMGMHAQYSWQYAPFALLPKEGLFALPPCVGEMHMDCSRNIAVSHASPPSFMHAHVCRHQLH